MSFFDTVKHAVYYGIEWCTEHESGLLLAGGLVAGVGAVVATGFASRKLDDILEEKENKLKRIDNVLPKTADMPKEDKKERIKLRTMVATETAVRLSKTYALPIALVLISGGLILRSHKVISARLMSSIAAYAVLQSDYDRLQKGVINHGYSPSELKEEVVVHEPVTEKNDNDEEVVIQDGFTEVRPSGYAFIFDKNNPNWSNSPLERWNYITFQLKAASNKLISHGKGARLFLNDFVREYFDLYDQSDLLTEAGQAVGWIYDPDDPNHQGDNYIGATITELGPNGEDGYLIDPNVDGVILHSLPKKSNVSEKLKLLKEYKEQEEAGVVHA